MQKNRKIDIALWDKVIFKRTLYYTIGSWRKNVFSIVTVVKFSKYCWHCIHIYVQYRSMFLWKYITFNRIVVIAMQKSVNIMILRSPLSRHQYCNTYIYSGVTKHIFAINYHKSTNGCYHYCRVDIILFNFTR